MDWGEAGLALVQMFEAIRFTINTLVLLIAMEKLHAADKIEVAPRCEAQESQVMIVMSLSNVKKLRMTINASKNV